MAILLQVQWVDRAGESAPFDPHLRIMHIGGVTGKMKWRHSQTQAIESIERKQFAYYVEKDALVIKLDVGHGADGKKFLVANGGNQQLLLTLPAFPAASPASV